MNKITTTLATIGALSLIAVARVFFVLPLQALPVLNHCSNVIADEQKQDEAFRLLMLIKDDIERQKAELPTCKKETRLVKH